MDLAAIAARKEHGFAARSRELAAGETRVRHEQTPQLACGPARIVNGASAKFTMRVSPAVESVWRLQRRLCSWRASARSIM